jgi:hypothetical protein
MMSNLQRITAILMVNSVLASVFRKGSKFPVISNEPHRIANFPRIKNILMVSSVVASVFQMRSAFQLI